MLVICGLAYLVYVPSQIVDWDNATRTLENLERKEMLFKLGIVAAICSFIIFILLPLVDKPGKLTHLRRMKLTMANGLPRFDLSLG